MRSRKMMTTSDLSSLPGPLLRFLLEPISKSFEEDDEAGKLDKAEEIVGVVLPANEDPALPLNPGEETLDEPARLHQDSARAAPPMPVAKPPKAATSNLRRVVGVRD